MAEEGWKNQDKMYEGSKVGEREISMERVYCHGLLLTDLYNKLVRFLVLLFTVVAVYLP